MLSSSKSDSKQEARFATRLDVLGERVDTLASTVATTASAIAKKDGEIASLRRELQVHDEQIQALAARTQVAHASVDPRELNELRQAVADLAGGQRKHGSSKQIDELAAKVALLGQRLESVSTTVSTTAAGLAGRDGELAAIRRRLEAPLVASAAASQSDPVVKRNLDDLLATTVSAKTRLDGHAAELEALKVQLARRDAEPQPPSDELRAMLSTLRAQVESLDRLRSGVTDEELDERLAVTNGALDLLSTRLDELAATVETATASLSDREHELAALHRHFTESSSRIEAIVDDIREALGAFPETDPGTLATVSDTLESTATGVAVLGKRVERLEADRADDLVAELAERIEAVDRRVATVSVEIGRAKTLWPVALRSLEARLDDVVAPRQADSAPVSAPKTAVPQAPTEDDADDLLAGLRHSLHAMETVAAELERSSDAWSVDTAPDVPDMPDLPTTQQAVVGGARVVPLRSSDP